jgi:hypothetical protein
MRPLKPMITPLWRVRHPGAANRVAERDQTPSIGAIEAWHLFRTCDPHTGSVELAPR